MRELCVFFTVYVSNKQNVKKYGKHQNLNMKKTQNRIRENHNII